MSQIYVKYGGEQKTYEFTDVFTPERNLVMGLTEPVIPNQLSERQVKTALCQKLDINMSELEDHYVEINPNGNITLRPESGWGT